MEGRSTSSDVYTFIRDYWHEWFPDLPSYQAFFRRLNNLVPAFQALAEIWAGMLCANFGESVQYNETMRRMGIYCASMPVTPQGGRDWHLIEIFTVNGSLSP